MKTLIFVIISLSSLKSQAFSISENEDKLVNQLLSVSEWQISDFIKDLNSHTEKSIQICLESGIEKAFRRECLRNLQKFRKKIYTKLNDRYESALDAKDKQFLEYSFIEKQIEKLTSL